MKSEKNAKNEAIMAGNICLSRLNSFCFWLCHCIVWHTLVIDSKAQSRFQLKKQGDDSLLQIAYHVSAHDRDETFNGIYWDEGSRTRFIFPHGTTQFRSGTVKGWCTHREFFFADEKGNPRIDSVLWAEGRMEDFMRVGVWRKFHLNGKVALERSYCGGRACGTLTLFNESGSVKASGMLNEKEFPHGLWRGEFPSGKPKFEINYEDGVTIGWSKHYSEEGLFSEVHFMGNVFANRYDEIKLYYPRSGRLKARLLRENQFDKLVEAWDSTGVQTVFSGEGNISGNFPWINSGFIETSLSKGLPFGEETRYYDAERSMLMSRTIRNSSDTNRYHRSTFYRNARLETEYSFLSFLQTGGPAAILDGPYTCYYSNGQPARKAVFKNDRLIGTYRSWNAAGVLMQEFSFLDADTSVHTAPFNLEDEMIAGSGIPDGIFRYWNEQGVLLREESYALGLRNGVWKTYHNNGMVATEQRYKADGAQGKSKHYDEKGKRVKLKVDCPNQNWGGGFLCSSHKGRSVTDDIGHCRSCGSGTSSGMYGLCASCACKQQKCQMCGRDL